MVFILLATALVVIVLMSGAMRHFSTSKEKSEEDTTVPVTNTIPNGECCGQHAVCARERLSVVGKAPEYYDDEELDRFRNHTSDSYADEEIEEFRNILYTMHESDVSGWVRSLEMRSIALPDALRDEVILIIQERRTITQPYG